MVLKIDKRDIKALVGEHVLDSLLVIVESRPLTDS
jgi:hypothetical protein